MEELPEHILLEIFSYLNIKTLKNLIDVCLRWSNLITTSRTLAKSKQAEYVTQKPSIFKNFFKFKYNSLPIYQHDEFYNFMSKFEDTLDDVTLNTIKCFETKNRFMNLKAFEKAKNLTIKNSEACEEINEKDSINFEWPNLRGLKIEKTFFGVEKYFLRSKLIRLELISVKSPSIDPNEEFWKSQAKSLQQLKVVNSKINPKFISLVVKEKNLQKLELDQFFLIKIPDLLLTLSENNIWKEMNFRGDPNSFETIKMIMSAFPSVTKLKIFNTTFEDRDELISHISNCFPNLEHLQLPLNYGNLTNKTKIFFKNLQTLEIEVIRYQIHVNKLNILLQNCPNLKILKIHWIGNHAVSHKFFTNILHNAVNIEQLHFGSPTDSFELSDEYIDLIYNEMDENLKIFTTYSNHIDQMREKFRKFNEKNVKCTVWNKIYEKASSTEAEIRKKLKLCSTFTWSLSK